jgi:YD repeat-containing protein
VKAFMVVFAMALLLGAWRATEKAPRPDPAPPVVSENHASELDSSGLPRRPKILKRDDRGRVLVEIDVRGWEVQYTRDEAGRVVHRTWVHPRNRNHTWVRCWTFEAETGRIIEEFDIVGNKKCFRYGEDGKVAETVAPDGFIEEAQQHRRMNLQTAETGARRPPDVTFFYDNAGRIVERREEPPKK